jgi:hypothetical protein
MTERCARLDTFIEEGRLIRGDWEENRDGREYVCLLVALSPEVVSVSPYSGLPEANIEECPADVMPAWLANLTPWIDDTGTEEEWPTVIQRYAALAKRWGVLYPAEWEQLACETQALFVRSVIGYVEPFENYVQRALDLCAPGPGEVPGIPAEVLYKRALKLLDSWGLDSKKIEEEAAKNLAFYATKEPTSSEQVGLSSEQEAGLTRTEKLVRLRTEVWAAVSNFGGFEALEPEAELIADIADLIDAIELDPEDMDLSQLADRAASILSGEGFRGGVAGKAAADKLIFEFWGLFEATDKLIFEFLGLFEAHVDRAEKARSRTPILHSGI